MEIKNLPAQKIEKLEDLTIRPSFPFYSRSKNLQFHIDRAREILIKALPNPLPFNDRNSLKEWLESSLPWMSWSPFGSPPDCISIFFLLKPLKNLPTETFVSEMIKRWLLPHQETTILSFEHMEFQFDHYPKETLFVGEAKILVRSKKEVRVLEKNLPLLRDEVSLAVKQGDYAKSLLETKVLPLDHKMNLIREAFIRLLQRYPDDLDETIFERLAFMQAHTSKEFREERSYAHIGRVILTFLLAQNQLTREINAFPEKRHMKIRFMQTKLSFPFGKKPVLGLAISLNLFDEYEFFDTKHVLRAAQKLIPDVRVVAGSSYRYTSLNGLILTLYVEIEKSNGLPMTLGEGQLLRENLEEELKKRVQRLVPALFMVRNEEETMRNILMLSRELKSPDDLPQIMVSFDQHSQEDLSFTIVLLRIKKEDSSSIQNLLKHADPEVRFISDRVQNVNYLDKEHPIEANVFSLQIEKLPIFLRIDFSVNLYLARNKIISFLMKHLGPVRDYNGGMMVKQGELLTQFKRLCQDLPDRNQELLENFFYSLNPIESQATIALPALNLFFERFIKVTEALFQREKLYLLEFGHDENVTVVTVRGRDPKFKSLLQEALSQTKIQSRSLITSSLDFEGNHYLSLLYEESSEKKRALFKKTVHQTLKTWEQERKELTVLKLPFLDLVSLDPRIGRDQESSIVVKLLFDGLMRISKEGEPEYAVAESYTVSEDKKTYTFKLKETFWSNGTPVVAYDFEYAWKKVLSPDFSTPFAYVFYPIKNGREAKEGKLPVDSVGVKAIDEKTLVIELNNPAPYFIELTANTLYSPVNHEVDMKHPNWAVQKNEHFVCNGPYIQVEPTAGYIYDLRKNPRYPKHDEVEIDQVLFSKVLSKSAFEMVRKNHLHCFGSGISPHETFRSDLPQGRISYYHSSRIFWQYFNTNQFPLNHKKIRMALSMAIDRSAIVKHRLGKSIPAYTVLPYKDTLCRGRDFLIKEDREKAKALFDEALREIGMKPEDLPILYLSCTLREKTSSEMIKNQWENVLGLKCELEFSKWNKLFQRLIEGDYQISNVHWVSWINDPIYTLQSFKHVGETLNCTRWENKEFQDLLNRSDQLTDPDQRKDLLFRAERLLTKEAVVLPICYTMDWYVKSSNLILSKSTINGNIDFSQAYFAKKNDKDG